MGCTYIHVFQRPGLLPECAPRAGTFGPLWWRPEKVQFPILSLDLRLEMAAH